MRFWSWHSVSRPLFSLVMLLAFGSAGAGPGVAIVAGLQDGIIRATGVLSTTWTSGENAYTLPFPVASVDLGALEVGKDHDIVLSLINSTPADIHFRKVVVGCACTDVAVEGNTFAAGDSHDLRIRFHHSSRASSPSARLVIFFHEADEPGEPVAEVRLSVALAGVLFLAQGSAEAVVPRDDSVHLEVPIVMTDPVQFGNLRLDVGDGLSGVSVRLAGPEGDVSSPRVVIEAEFASLPEAGVRGRVDLEDSKTGARTGMDVLLRRAEQIEISPRLLRFRKDADTSGQRAIALIQVKPTEPGGAIPEITQVVCQASGIPVASNFALLGNGVYKVELSVPDPEDHRPDLPADQGHSPRVLQWAIGLSTGQTVSSSTPFRELGK